MVGAGTVVVTKTPPVIVHPSASAGDGGGGTVALSYLDRSMPSIPVTSLLAFEHPIDNPVEARVLRRRRALHDRVGELHA